MSINGRHNADGALIAALASGQTYEAAAKQVGVSERTARRRMAEPAFRAAVLEARREVVTRAVATCAAGSVQAAAVLVELLGDAAPWVRLAAARALLAEARAGIDQLDILARIEALEQRAAERGAS